MKKILVKALHFLKLDVLLLRVLERLSAGLTKKLEGFKLALEVFVGCRISATTKDTSSSALA